MKAVATWTLQCLSALAGCLTALCLLGAHWRPAKLFVQDSVLVARFPGAFAPRLRMAIAVFARGRCPNCSVAQSVSAAEYYIGNHERLAVSDVLARSRRVDAIDDLELWQTPAGRFWIPQGDAYYLALELVEEKMEARSAIAKPGGVFIDCGASMGTTTRAALNAGASLVVAVEPSPRNITCLRRTFHDEVASKRVIIYPKGVWDKDEMLEMTLARDGTGGDTFILNPEARGKVVVPLTTIDHTVDELRLQRVDVIKMDIEGAERRAAAGAAGTLRRFRPHVAISGYHLPDDPAVITKAIRSVVPAYRVRHERCVLALDRIMPETLLFEADHDCGQ